MAKLAPRKIALIGAMGSGKSTLAARYAAKHGSVAYDVDEEFTRRYGDISAFFGGVGEQAFRKVETELLIEAAQSDCEVIACGGGAVLSSRGMAALRGSCEIVYLSAPNDVLKERIKNSERPLKHEFDKLMTERAPLYERYADYTVNTACDNAYSELERVVSFPRPNRYDVVLCDADDTILDFQTAMRTAVIRAARAVGITHTDELIISEYSKIIKIVWEKLERGEITRAELDRVRFNMLKDALNSNFDAKAMNDIYIAEMQKTRFVIDGAIEFLRAIRARGMRVYIVTNSFTKIAEERLKALGGEIDGAFISEKIGYNKPDVRFFEYVHNAVGTPDKRRMIIFGDSVTSDIAGGIAFGIDACLFDVSGKKQTDAAYKAGSYAEFERIL